MVIWDEPLSEGALNPHGFANKFHKTSPLTTEFWDVLGVVSSDLFPCWPRKWPLELRLVEPLLHAWGRREQWVVGVNTNWTCSSNWKIAWKDPVRTGGSERDILKPPSGKTDCVFLAWISIARRILPEILRIITTINNMKIGKEKRQQQQTQEKGTPPPPTTTTARTRTRTRILREQIFNLSHELKTNPNGFGWLRWQNAEDRSFWHLLGWKRKIGHAGFTTVHTGNGFLYDIRYNAIQCI